MTGSSKLSVTPADGATSSDVIVRVPGVCGGVPILKGTRIRVSDIVQMKNVLGYTTGAIIRAHPGLHKKWIQAAMQYYRAHQADINLEIKLDQ